MICGMVWYDIMMKLTVEHQQAAHDNGLTCTNKRTIINSSKNI